MLGSAGGTVERGGEDPSPALGSSLTPRGQEGTAQAGMSSRL